MNPTEAAELLGHAAAFDNRNPSAAAAVAWASALHDIPLDNDAKAAVAAYYTTAPQNPVPASSTTRSASAGTVGTTFLRRQSPASTSAP